MPRDIDDVDDEIRRPDRSRAHGEIFDDESHDPDASGSDLPERDRAGSRVRREHGARRSSWDEKEDWHEGYR
ncbi:hypothetical protein ABZ845_26470 [Streptomyces sp. NPDC047022]|uniref:hypothetical protein n=1 Tax=Streptomyces sp. NPDC047022 TaxID=3155737 RepID=UPI0033D6E938